MNRIPTGPAGNQFPLFEAGPFAYLKELQQHGQVVAIDLDGIATAVLYDLDLIHNVFADKLEHIGRSAAIQRLSSVTGNGILTNYDWKSWQPRRKGIVRPLGARAVGQFHERMVDIIDDYLGALQPGSYDDLTETIRRLTLRVVSDLLFTTDLTPAAIDIIDTAIIEIHDWAEADPANTNYTEEPDSLRAAATALEDFMTSVIEARDPSNPGQDMVGLLIAASNEPDSPYDATAIREEAITLILAGHDTVTNSTSFALDLVARHPSKREADARHIVDETLRLYPPVHLTNKGVVADFSLGDFIIPTGWEILVPQYVIYRDSTHFERPEEFLPERWSDDSPLHLERRAYFPFLTGPKFCLGRHFAIMESAEIISRFLNRFNIEMANAEAPWGREFALSYGPDRALPYELDLR